MNELNINKLLNREDDVLKIKEILMNFELNKKDLSLKKGIYIYGDPGTGKSIFITNILKELNYDIISYDAGDIRNKLIIDNITKHTQSDKNIMSIFNKKIKKIVIVMDEIDGMNKALDETNNKGIMTRPVWKLMSRLLMFKNCQNDGLYNSIWLEDRAVNIPSSVQDF